MSDIDDRVAPDLQVRLEEAVDAFRAAHTNPANLALHVAAFGLLTSGVLRTLRGRVVSGVLRTGAGVACLVLGHRIEGNEPFDFARRMGDRRA